MDPDIQAGEFICNIHLDYMTYTVEKIGDQYITHYENEYCKINHSIRKDNKLYKCCGHSRIYETRDAFMEYLTNTSSDIYYTTEPMKKLDVFEPHTIPF